MAKRGRPPKQKIEAVKNPVGRPKGESKKSFLTKKEIYAKWAILSHYYPNLSQMEKRELLTSICVVSDEKVSRAITQYNREIKKGKRTFIYEFNSVNAIVIATDWEIKSAEFSLMQGRDPKEHFNFLYFRMPDLNF